MVSVKKAAIVGGSIGLIILFAGPALVDAISSATFIPGEMPACDSPYVKNLLKSAISQGPLAKQTGMTVSSIGQGATITIPGALPGAEGKWFCSATVYSNGGKMTALFTTEWTTEAKDEIWLQVGSLQPSL